MKRDGRLRTLPALLLAAVAAAGAGCSETDIQGVVLEEDLNDAGLMLALVRGVDSEFIDAYTFSDVLGGYIGDTQSATDAFVDDGTSEAEENISTSRYYDRLLDNAWNQALEASWAGMRAIERMRTVLDAETFNTSPLVARAYVVAGMAERILGEAYSEAVFGFGPDGGFLLPGPQEYDNTVVVSRDSIFRRSATLFELGLAFAERAVAAGVPTPDDDPLFDPQNLVYTAHGGAAQAYMAMASLGRNTDQNWDLAVQHARQVPTDFVAVVALHQQVDGGSDFHDIAWENDDVTVWGAVIGGQLYGTPAAALWADDPRVSFTRCGDFAAPPALVDGEIQGEVVDNEDDSCDSYITESDTYPLWAPDKHDDEGSDVELVSGTEMRLIEAEAAMLDGNLAEFTNQVNQAREFVGAAPIAQPATVGDFEWPNAEDDARSILDRERYLTLWLEGRRAFDLSRWDHPWITEGHTLIPRHADLLRGGPRPFEALPIPLSECNINAELNCPQLVP